MTAVEVRLTEFSELIRRYTADFVGREWLAALQHRRRLDQGSATIFVPRVSGSVQTHRPVNAAKSAAREMPPPSP